MGLESDPMEGNTVETPNTAFRDDNVDSNSPTSPQPHLLLILAADPVPVAHSVPPPPPPSRSHLVRRPPLTHQREEDRHADQLQRHGHLHLRHGLHAGGLGREGVPLVGAVERQRDAMPGYVDRRSRFGFVLNGFFFSFVFTFTFYPQDWVILLQFFRSLFPFDHFIQDLFIPIWVLLPCNLLLIGPLSHRKRSE